MANLAGTLKRKIARWIICFSLPCWSYGITAFGTKWSSVQGLGMGEARLAGTQCLWSSVSMKNPIDQILDLLGLGIQLFILSNWHRFLMYFRPSSAVGAVPSHSTHLKRFSDKHCVWVLRYISWARSPLRVSKLWPETVCIHLPLIVCRNPVPEPLLNKTLEFFSFLNSALHSWIQEDKLPLDRFIYRAESLRLPLFLPRLCVSSFPS